MLVAGLQYNKQPPPMADHYSVLGVAVDFSPEELKARYKKQSKAHHPDRNDSEEC